MGLVRSFTQQKPRLPKQSIPTSPTVGTSPTLVGIDRSTLENRVTFHIYNTGSLPVIMGHSATVSIATQVATIYPGELWYEEFTAPWQGPISLLAIGGSTSVNCEDQIII